MLDSDKFLPSRDLQYNRVIDNDGFVASIVVIDDDELVRTLLCTVLERHGHVVRIADDGKKGFALLKLTAADLVITDLIMPNQEGIETIRQLRAFFPEIPILAISGTSMAAKYLSLASKLGARRTLLKPFSVDSLIEAVNDLLDEHPCGKVREYMRPAVLPALKPS